MPMETKVCNKCHLELPLSLFTVANKAKGWLLGACKKCASARVRAIYASNPAYRTKQKANSEGWAKANPERAAVLRRKSDIKRRFNLTPEQFDQLLAAQDTKCALCGATEHGRSHNNGRTARLPTGEFSNWPIDHCHKDGRVRGILCHKCNTRLGGYEALVEKVGEANLLEYLTRPSPVLALPVPSPVVDVRATARFVAELPPRYTRGQCSVVGCGIDQHAGNLCFKHYMRARRRGGDVGPAENIQKGVLTPDDVRAIRAAPAEHGIGTRLAAQYRVTVSMISKIRNGTARAGVTEEAA
jgi:hypothetical protein